MGQAGFLELGLSLLLVWAVIVVLSSAFGLDKSGTSGISRGLVGFSHYAQLAQEHNQLRNANQNGEHSNTRSNYSGPGCSGGLIKCLLIRYQGILTYFERRPLYLSILFCFGCVFFLFCLFFGASYSLYKKRFALSACLFVSGGIASVFWILLFLPLSAR